jgi:hypothetical protein
MGMAEDMIKSIAADALRKQGDRFIKKDKDNKGNDDVAGFVMKASAGIIDAISFDISKLSNTANLRNIGLAFKAAGEEILETLDEQEAEEE